MSRKSCRFLLFAFLAFIFVLSPVASASAATPISHGTYDFKAAPSVNGPDLCGTGSLAQEDSEMLASPLPLERWADSMSLHSRLGSWAWQDVGDKIGRDNILGMVFGGSNMMWSVSQTAVTQTVKFCPLERFGSTVDALAGEIGRMFLSGAGAMIVTALLSVFIAVTVWRFYKTGNAQQAMRGVMAKLVIVGLLATMAVGATNSKAGTGGFKPGAGSPAWWAMTIDSSIASISNGLAWAVTESLSETISQTEVDRRGEESATALSCNQYIRSMGDTYKESFGKDDMDRTLATAPWALSQMWEVTGLRSWSAVQMGAKNGHASYTFCRVLDINSGIRNDKTSKGGPRNAFPAHLIKNNNVAVPKSAYNAVAFTGSDNNAVNDAVYVAWAACRLKSADSWGDKNGWKPTRSGWDLVPGSEGKDGNGSNFSEACWDIFNSADAKRGGVVKETIDGVKEWVGGKGEKVIPGGEEEVKRTGVQSSSIKFFDWGDGTKKIKQADWLGSGSRDFLIALHGGNTSSGYAYGFAYAASALTMMIVFGGLSLTVLIAKLAAMVVVLTMPVILVASLFPGAGMEKLVRALRTYFGLSIFAFFYTAVVSLVVVFSVLFIQLGGALVS